MKAIETKHSLWLGSWTDPVHSTRKARKAAVNHNPINAALWALSGFDLTCGKFADLREDLTRRYPDTTDPLHTAMDAALSAYLKERSLSLRLDNNCGRDEIDRLADAAVGGRDVNATAMKAVRCANTAGAYHTMVPITEYAITLAAVSSHGPAPFNRFADIIDECYAQMFRTGHDIARQT